MTIFLRRSWRMASGPAAMIKAAIMVTVTAYLLWMAAFGLNISARAQDRVQQTVTTGELLRRIERLEDLSLDKRVAVLETVFQQTTNRLDSIEGLMRGALAAMALLLGEAAWKVILKVRGRG